MEQTEKYLNSILQKRIGSVINHTSFTKKTTTVTRVPCQEEKIESMPTVFRKKHETIYTQKNNTQFQIHQERSSFMSSQMRRVDELEQQQQPAKDSQRVEYMAISKRIQQKKESQFTSPTVDITQYRLKSNTVLNPITSKLNISTVTDSKNHQKSIYSVCQNRSRQSSFQPKKRKIFN